MLALLVPLVSLRLLSSARRASMLGRSGITGVIIQLIMCGCSMRYLTLGPSYITFGKPFKRMDMVANVFATDWRNVAVATHGTHCLRSSGFLGDFQDLCLCAMFCFRRVWFYVDQAIVKQMSSAVVAKRFVATWLVAGCGRSDVRVWILGFGHRCGFVTRFGCLQYRLAVCSFWVFSRPFPLVVIHSPRVGFVGCV